MACTWAKKLALQIKTMKKKLIARTENLGFGFSNNKITIITGTERQGIHAKLKGQRTFQKVKDK